MTVLSRCGFLAVRAGLSPPSSVTNTHHAEIAISVSHHGPRLNSRTREERFYLLSCLLTQPFNAPSPELALWESLNSSPSSCLVLSSLGLLRPCSSHSILSCEVLLAKQVWCCSCMKTLCCFHKACVTSGDGVTHCLTPGWAHRVVSSLPAKVVCATPLVLRLHMVYRWCICTRTYRLGKYCASKLGGQGSTGWWQTAKIEVR